MTDKRFAELAQRYNVSLAVVQTLATALQVSNCRSAQFSHPELGGMGQWMPGMVMVGNMFDNALKAKVDGLCTELVSFICAEKAGTAASTFASSFDTEVWWRKIGLKQADVMGGQNELAYAYDASQDRLAIKYQQQIRVYDTAGYRITGVSQQQSDGRMRLVLHTDKGKIGLSTLADRIIQ